MTIKIENFLSDINTYLETADNSKSVSSRGLDDFVLKICTKTGLKKNISSVIVAMFFNEIRNSMLRGDVVTIRDLGKFFISSPNTSKNKTRVFAKFKPYKKLLKRMNDI